ncbi:MAG: hypothetical protein OEU46_21630 [Alphaproteobacteria bacterium]|nr:hypothetical protein [Alphaproteobacteria bacterium]
MRLLTLYVSVAFILACISGVLFLFKDELRSQIIRVTVFEWMGLIFVANIVFTAAIVLLTHYAEKIKQADSNQEQ